MKINKILTLSTILLTSTALFSVALAKDVGLVNVDTNVNTNLQARDGNASGTIEGNANINVNSQREDNSTSTRDGGDNATNTENRNNSGTSTEADSNGEVTAAAHRSAVATFVKSLLNVANREGGIGAEVRVIARDQNDSASTTATAIAKVDDRGALRTFLFGSDYRNLGVIRSEMATTSNNIDHLNTLLGQTTNVADRAELTAQINVLQVEQTKLNAYVNAHENVFSLFGWFARLFNR
jgi:hypothetical protein